jgi:hypothetical protein
MAVIYRHMFAVVGLKVGTTLLKIIFKETEHNPTGTV